MVGNSFLATYHPLVETVQGRRAAQSHGLPPFIDGSCRREPDFESRFPSISALCRKGKFAPRLHEDDRVAYLTIKYSYQNDYEDGWRLVAILQIIKRFASHEEAAAWYRDRGEPPPSNCLVAGNPPEDFKLTSGKLPSSVRKRLAGRWDDALAVRLWDNSYRQRTAEWPVFLASEKLFLNLHNPPQLRQENFLKIFGRIRVAQNPPRICQNELERLLRFATALI